MLLFAMTGGGCSMLAPAADAGDEVTVRIYADRHLNYYQGRAHALVMHIYQLKSVDAFRRVLGQHHGPAALLNGTAPFPVLAREALVVQPGQRSELRISRAGNSRYLAIVAGYYQFSERVDYARLYTLQRINNDSVLWQYPLRERLVIDLILGDSAIGGHG